MLFIPPGYRGPPAQAQSRPHAGDHREGGRMRRMRRGVIAPLAGVSLVPWLALPLVTNAAAAGKGGNGKGHGDTFELAPDVHAKINRVQSAVVNSNATHAPEVGDVRTWLGLDDEEGFYPKSYELRAVGEHIEGWRSEEH